MSKKFLVGNIRGPQGERGEQGIAGPRGEQGIQGPVGPAGGVDSVNGKTGDVNIADALGYTPAGGQGINTFSISVPWQIGGITPTGIIDYSNKYALYSDKIAIDHNTNYTLSFSQYKEYDVELNVFAYKNDGTFVEQILNWNLDEIKTFVTSDKYDNIALVLRDGYKHVLANITDVPNYKIKLEKGTVTDPVWTPAPEDVVVRSELEIQTSKITMEPGISTEINVIKKWGHIISLDLTITDADEYTTTGWKKIGTLPENWRPKNRFDFIAVDNTEPNYVQTRLTSNGDINVYFEAGKYPLSKFLIFHTTFLA